MQTWDWVVFGVLGLLAVAVVWLLAARRRTAREAEDLRERARKLEARQDRLQRMITAREREHGWRDSLDLTRFDWERKGGA